MKTKKDYTKVGTLKGEAVYTDREGRLCFRQSKLYNTYRPLSEKEYELFVNEEKNGVA